MAVTITEAFVQQFRGNVIHLSQQKQSKLEGRVRVETGVTGELTHFERLNKTDPVQRTTRHGDTPLVMSVHTRRAVSMTDWEWADLVDKEDKVRALITPESEYALAASAGMNRKKDKLIIAAAVGSAYGGKAGTTEVVYDTANYKIEEAGTDGLTLDKLIQAREMLELSDVDEDEPRFFVCSPKQITNLLKITEVKSSDYNTVKALVAGQVNEYMGFTFVRTNYVQKTTTMRDCFAYVKQGLGLAIGLNVVTRITERADKSYSTQVYLSMTLGATRIEDEKVIWVECYEG